MGKQTFYVTTTHPGHGMKVDIQARQHRLVADEPLELGGTDAGANPVEILLGALGACQSVVAQVYAEKFGLRFDSLRIELEGDIDLDGFFDKATVRSGFSDIRYKFIFETQEAPEKFQKFIDYVEQRCPVGDTLANPVALSRAEIVVKATAQAA